MSADVLTAPTAPPKGQWGHSGSVGNTKPRRPHDAGPQGQEKWKAYEKTLRDPKVRRARRLFFDVLEQAIWYVDPAGAGKRAGVVADYCAELLSVGRLVGPQKVIHRPGQLRGGWPNVVSKLGNAAWDGFRTMEMVFTIGQSRVLRSARPLVYIDRFADMEPSSVSEWYSEDGERPYALRQRATYNSRRAPATIVPLWKLLYLPYGETGAAWEGRGLLDALVDVVKDKATVRGGTSVAFDRAGHPIPEVSFDYKAYHETEMLLGEGRIDPPDAWIEQGKEMAAKVRYDEQAHTVKTNFLGLGRAFGEVNIDAAERWMAVLNGEIDAVGLAGWLDLDTAGTGSVGDLRRGTQRRAVLGVINKICAAVREQVFIPCIRWSFGPAAVADAPKLTVAGIGSERLLEAMQFLAPLANQQLVDPERIQGPMTDALVGPDRNLAPPGSTDDEGQS